MERAAAAPDERTDWAFDWSLPTQLSQHVQKRFAALETNERALLALRSNAVHNNARNTNVILLSAAALTFLILILAGNLVSRETMTRAELHAGLTEAQELLGVKFEVQRGELGHAIKDLNIQIRKRQHAEGELRALNSELEKRVSRRTEQLQEVNKELETFSYAVSHDLRAPLRHMEGFTHFLQHKYGPTLPEEGQHYLNRISTAATFMSKLVEGLLQLSHVGAQLPNIAPVALRALLHDARNGLQTECKGREIEWRIGTLPDAEGDAVLLSQVFTNLLSNAIKFSIKQGHPIIEIGSCDGMGSRRYSFATTGWASTRVMPTNCSECFSGCTVRMSFRGQESGWPPCSASFTAMAGESGRNPRWARAPLFSSRCRTPQNRPRNRSN